MVELLKFILRVLFSPAFLSSILCLLCLSFKKTLSKSATFPPVKMAGFLISEVITILPLCNVSLLLKLAKVEPVMQNP